jgi:rhamnosyltransferase subunit B
MQLTILLLAIGSAGDVHPFIGLGLALQKRGHRVKIITNPIFAELAAKVGLEMIPLGTVEEFDLLRKNPDLWHATKGFHTVAGAICRGLRETYDAIVNNYVAGETIVVASSLGLAARIAQDKLSIPTVTVHLAPSIIRSVIAPAKLPGLAMPAWLPLQLRKWVYALADTLVIDRALGPAVNGLRAELGLASVRRIFAEWWNSPQLIIGLFPEWFADRAGDWPTQLRLTGFPLYDEAGVSDLPADLADFLSTGEAPIVFTPGSAMWHAHDIFRESVEACVRINRRAILLSGHDGHIPAQLPPTIRAFRYAPFSQLLPRTAVLVHHGGIGTSAQAMAAGVKQVVMPFAFDQFDNAARMERLGVAKVINPRKYRAREIAELLKQVLADVSMEARCREISRRFVGIDPVGQSCDLIESLMRS